MPVFGRRSVARAAAVRSPPPVARRTRSPRPLRPVAQPPSPESKPGLSANRLRCLSASHRFPGADVARSLRSVARPRLPRWSPGLPVARPRRPLDSVHADPVNRAIVGRRRTLSEFAVGVLARSRPGHLSARGPRLPGDWYFEACGFSLRPEPLSPRGSGPFSVLPDPKIRLPRLGLSTPVCVRSPVRDIPSRT